MKTLLHICCGSCAIYPLRVLREQDYDVTGYYFNPNIHPYQEYRRRADSLGAYSKEASIPVIWGDYSLERYFRAIAHREEDRCRICYTIRIEEVARRAKALGFGGFTTTLLYSKYQKHQIIREVGELIGQQENIPFVYRDFREGWQEGINMSRKMGMYRQGYCGCLYSEKDRYQSLGAT